MTAVAAWMKAAEAAWREWIAALRSGKWAQGRGRLGLNSFVTGREQYCCLGVACVIAPDTAVKWGVSGMLLAEGSQLDLPRSAARWLGLEDGEEDVRVHLTGQVRTYLRDVVGLAAVDESYTLREGETVRVSAFNDVWKLTFAQIADVLELELSYRLEHGKIN